MDLYQKAAYATARLITQTYSTSFGMATRLFSARLRPDIYNVYGLVRLADEIVDTYTGNDRAALLDSLEQETRAAIARGYSTNLVVQAYADTARCFNIAPSVYAAFFTSMRMDLDPRSYRAERDYTPYIHGSAEVVGLMCLSVFCQGDQDRYRRLEAGAMRLGAAFQKVNFLRDLKDDNERLGRYYFPAGSYDTFDDAHKQAIIAEIEADFTAARPAIAALPPSARPAVAAACRYYETLLAKLRRTPAAVLKRERVRIPNAQKLAMLATVWLTRGAL